MKTMPTLASFVGFDHEIGGLWDLGRRHRLPAHWARERALGREHRLCERVFAQAGLADGVTAGGSGDCVGDKVLHANNALLGEGRFDLIVDRWVVLVLWEYLRGAHRIGHGRERDAGVCSRVQSAVGECPGRPP